MRNNYNYIDPDYTYTDPKTGVLRNLADITDSDGLLFFESAAVMSCPRLHIALMEINKPLLRRIKCLKALVVCTIILFALLFLFFLLQYTVNPSPVSDHGS